MCCNQSACFASAHHIPPRQVVGLSGSSCMSLISSSCTVFPMCLHAWRPIGARVSCFEWSKTVDAFTFNYDSATKGAIEPTSRHRGRAGDRN